MNDVVRYLPASWVQTWLKGVNQDDETPPRLLGFTGRNLLWNMCYELGVDGNGIPGQACRLFERFLARRLPEDQAQRLAFTQHHLTHLPLYLASCVQLAAKMCSASSRITARVLRVALLLKGISYSIPQIVATELQIFSTLDFRVPLWTSVDVAEVLVMALGVRRRPVLEGVALVTQLAELRRVELDARVHWGVNLYRNNRQRPLLRTLPLAAGAVLATTRRMHCTQVNEYPLDPSTMLAELTQVPAPYIQCISDAILIDCLRCTPPQLPP